MSPQVISIDKKKYAVGLFWQPIGIGQNGRNYARLLARSVDKRLIFFSQYRAMVGLGARRFGHKHGMPAAAAEVMESFAEFSSFLAAFKVGDIFWIVAVRNGIILQDALFETEQTARAEYVRLSSMPDWGSAFAPSAWNMPRAVERRIDDVITGNAKATLHTISRFKTNFLSLFLVLLLLFGMVYIFKGPVMRMISPQPSVSQINPTLAAEYKKRIAEKNSELDNKFNIKREPVAAPLVMPYDRLPTPSDRANQCYSAIGFLMQNVPGWLQTNAECYDAYAVVTFKRDFGNLGDFYTVLSDIMPGVYAEEKSESEIQVTTKLPPLNTVSSIDARNPDDIVREINTKFQRLNSDVNTNITVDTVGDDTQSFDLNVIEVGAKSKLTPLEFIKIFDDVRGVYMTLAAWDVRSRTWNYEVIIYAK